MSSLTQATATAYLRELGWRIRTTSEYKQVVALFQESWNLGKDPLKIDNIMGTVTSDALRLSIKRKRAGLPTASAHFSFSEFVCKCGGRYSSCLRVKMLRPHIQRLERYRANVGSVTVVSGYRCPGHNKAVGGASSSQHMYGCASDVRPTASLSRVRGLGLFAGIGYVKATGRVAHCDSRDKGGHNTTGGSPSRPTIWAYY